MVIVSTDHKVIAKQFLWLGLAFLVIGAGLALAIRIQLAHPHNGLITPAGYAALFSMHGTIMIFFAVTPILIGAFGNFLIPLSIGARDMAFPGLNAASFWTLLLAGLVLCSSFFVPLGPGGAGWSSYAPLSTPVGMPGPGETLWTLAVILAGISSTMGAINYLTTIIRMRAPGMGWFRLPLTLWGLFLTALLTALFVPVLASSMILLLCDRIAGTHFFISSWLVQHPGDPLLYQHLFWIFGHPEVYILILPAWGITSDLLAFFARKPAYAYKVNALSMVAVCALSGTVYGHHMFTTSMSPLLGQGFMVLSMVIGLPATILFVTWLGTLWGGTLRLQSPMLFALGVMVVFAAGGLSGIFLADIPMDIYLHDTYFVVGHFHLIMAAAVLLGSFAGIYFWFPKMFGRMMNERLARLHFWLTFVPLLAIFGGMLVLGNAGMQRRLFDASDYVIWRPLFPLNLLLSRIAYLLFAAQGLFAWNFLHSLAAGERAPDNPWQVGTLEWSVSSPPPAHNFDRIPQVLHGPHELARPELLGKDWLGQAEPLPDSVPPSGAPR